MKRVLSICLVMVLVFTATACGSKIADEWSKLAFGDQYPIPSKGKLNIGSNLDDYFSGSVENVKEEVYYEYKEKCIEAGYTIDSESTGTRYEAFNVNGYQVSISYIGDDMHLILQKPEEFSNLIWPTAGLGALLPVPKSLFGKVETESSKSYKVYIGETSLEDFRDYVKRCEDSGFSVDFVKNEKNYSAKSGDGYRLNINYEGCNRISIMIQTPKEETTVTTTTTTQKTDGIGSDFKAAMDAYETFMNKYVDFMKKYQANPTDLSLLADYATYMSDYATFCSEFAEWENEDLNAAELAYYVDVQARVTKKLLEVAG